MAENSNDKWKKESNCKTCEWYCTDDSTCRGNLPTFIPTKWIVVEDTDWCRKHVNKYYSGMPWM